MSSVPNCKSLWIKASAKWLNVKCKCSVYKNVAQNPCSVMPVIDLIICINLPTSRSLARVRRDVIKPSDKLRLLKQPARKTREAVRAADYMVQTLRLISEKAHHVHKRSINATGMKTAHCKTCKTQFTSITAWCSMLKTVFSSRPADSRWA